jgi:hypothetical protein
MSSSLSVSSADSNDDVSVLNIDTSTTVPESVVTSQTTSSKRFRWPSMELRVVKDAHGSKRDSYPFLLYSNEQDKALIRNLLVYRPFLQKKGKQMTAWTNVVEMTFETTLPTGKKVFPKKISTDAAIKSCKKRLADYVDFMKKYHATKPTHNSGGDNELFSDNLRALEDLYHLHESFKNTTNEKKTSAADARARDRAEGDAIRDASLGLFVAARDGGSSEDDQAEVLIQRQLGTIFETTTIICCRLIRIETIANVAQKSGNNIVLRDRKLEDLHVATEIQEGPDLYDFLEAPFHRNSNL